MRNQEPLTHKKLIVVWICHFSNAEVQSILKPMKRFSEYAPWIPSTARVFEHSSEVELHIISPHEYIPWRKSFQLRGIHYHFFNPGIPLLGRHWPAIFRWDVLTDFKDNKRIIKRIVNKINPDVIHLQGAENARYSSSVFQFASQYPVVVNIQRMVLDFRLGTSPEALKRVSVEKAILTQFKHFSVRTDTMKQDLLTYNPNAIVHWVRYSIRKLKPIQVQKEFDLVFFARICKDKGIEDLIQALSIVRRSLPNTTLCVIGGRDEQYKMHLDNLSKECRVDDAITWTGKLRTLDEVHKQASKARISVLPTHYDIISGTILESMQLGLPVVSYKTGSIPELNNDRENLLLVDIGDIEGLAKNIIRLLQDNELHELMARRGIDCMEKRYSADDILEQHLNCYRGVIKDSNAVMKGNEL